MGSLSLDPYLMQRCLTRPALYYIASISRSRSATALKMTSKPNAEPPNVLVYKPVNFTLCPKRCPIGLIEKCLSADKFVVYPLPQNKCLEEPWVDNAQLLVIPNTRSNSKATFAGQEVEVFKKFLSKGGKILNFSHALTEKFDCMVEKLENDGDECHLIDQEGGSVLLNTDLWRGYIITSWSEAFLSCKTVLSAKLPTDETRPTAVLCKTEGGGLIVHCLLSVLEECEREKEECETLNKDSVAIIQHCLKSLDMDIHESKSGEENVTETPCFAFSSSSGKFVEFLSKCGIDAVGPHILKGNPVSVQFTPVQTSKNSDELPPNTSSLVPIIYQEDSGEGGNKNCTFDSINYFQNLKSEEFGHVVIYGDIVSSTMDILDPILTHLPPHTTVTCIARQQTGGRGRGGNKWLSPIGTAMFSLSLSVPLNSRLGQHLSILQHFITVAVVHSIRSLPGLEELDLRVKWPNDIYFGSDVKIGGVLVKSTLFKGICIATIGCGVNVSNNLPTTCINDIIRDSRPGHDPLTCEEVLARTITCLERIIKKYQSEGPEHFLYLYYMYWIHSMADVKVQLPGESGNVETVDATIVGIDESGFLRVSLKSNNKIISLQPDGNSFDIMKNLIAMKGSL